MGDSYLRPLASDGGKLSCRVTNRVIERGGNGLTKTGIGPASGRRAQTGLRNWACAALELVDAFRSVRHRSPSDDVFTGRGGKRLSTRTAARWTAERFTKA